jgi:hypothetical protein
MKACRLEPENMRGRSYGDNISDDLGLSCLPLLTRRRRDVGSSSWTAALPPTHHRYRCSLPSVAPVVAVGRCAVPRNMIGWVAKGLSGRVAAASRRVWGAAVDSGDGRRREPRARCRRRLNR